LGVGRRARSGEGGRVVDDVLTSYWTLTAELVDFLLTG
jgi:hypothetical protein